MNKEKKMGSFLGKSYNVKKYGLIDAFIFKLFAIKI